MNLEYFAAEKGNFGDDLNPYIFHKLFPSCFTDDNNPDIDFYGIGTLIDSRISFDKKAILFGTGIRDISRQYRIDNWDVCFLRGPVSSNILGFRGEKYITDSAYLIRFVDDTVNKLKCSEKKYKASVIPHYRQMDSVNWAEVKELTGVHVIDPRQSVEDVLNEISHSEKIIAGAMHGAIMADICRIPWIRLRINSYPYERPLISDIKWLDWLHSIEIYNDVTVSVHNLPLTPSRKLKNIFQTELTFKIDKIKNKEFVMSGDKVIAVKLEQLSDQIELFNKKYVL